jgi:hypothetical protein
MKLGAARVRGGGVKKGRTLLAAESWISMAVGWGPIMLTSRKLFESSQQKIASKA